MSTTHIGPHLREAFTPRWRIASILKRYWAALQDDRRRRTLRATLSDLSDRELIDIGTTRSEIDYVASHRDADPRGIRSA